MNSRKWASKRMRKNKHTICKNTCKQESMKGSKKAV